MNCYHCQSTETARAGKTYQNKQRFFCRSCRRYFREDRVLNARTAPLLSPHKSLPSKSQMILQLQSLAQDLGRTPTGDDLAARARAGKGSSVKVYQEVFGGLRRAVLAARLTPHQERELNRDHLLLELQNLSRRLNRLLTIEDVQRRRNSDEIGKDNKNQ